MASEVLGKALLGHAQAPDQTLPTLTKRSANKILKRERGKKKGRARKLEDCLFYDILRVTSASEAVRDMVTTKQKVHIVPVLKVSIHIKIIIQYFSLK